MMPRHVNPTTPARTATAPYNFVPLPEQVFPVEEGIAVDGERIKPWEHHDEYIPGTHSGWIDLNIETLTPLYIRGRLAKARDVWDTRPAKLRPDCYTTSNGLPAIPGSSLRGMVRTLVEILSFSKIQPVTRSEPFFRDISRGRIGTEYRRHFVQPLGTLTAGFGVTTNAPITQNASGSQTSVRAGFIDPATRTITECDFARIPHNLIPAKCRDHRSTIWVIADTSAKDYFFEAKPGGHPDLYLRFRKVHQARCINAPGYRQAKLVVTGPMAGKHLEFVFLDCPTNPAPIPILGEVWKRFHDDGQLTQWQEKTFPKDSSSSRRRAIKGHVGEAEPVFFLTDPRGEVLFFGRAQMFRFPYDLSPRDLVPTDLRDAELDLAESMFGPVPERRSTATAIKSRLAFEDAVATGDEPSQGWFDELIVPGILSSPKPTTFQHYLTQDEPEDQRALKTYLRGDHTVIRGHKLYWHRWDIEARISQVKKLDNHDQLLNDLQQPAPSDSQHTIMRPVRDGVSFSGRIRFSNLTDIELGALLGALRLPDGCAHKLGMAKPLGLGSVHIDASLHLVCMKDRYAAWSTEDIGVDSDTTFINAFHAAIMEHARATGEPGIPHASGLRSVVRLDALYRLLEWNDRPQKNSTRGMLIENDTGPYPPDNRGRVNAFKARPVLPTPDQIPGPPGPPRVAPVRPIEQGQFRSGRFRRTGGGTWVARLEGDDRDAVVTYGRSAPSNINEEQVAIFWILSQSKRKGIRCRFERWETDDETA